MCDSMWAASRCSRKEPTSNATAIPNRRDPRLLPKLLQSQSRGHGSRPSVWGRFVPAPPQRVSLEPDVTRPPTMSVVNVLGACIPSVKTCQGDGAKALCRWHSIVTAMSFLQAACVTSISAILMVDPKIRQIQI